jgi:dTDP-4-dehydrorhamnose 3,5-epimerase
MKIVGTTLPEVRVIEPRVFDDERGFFLEICTRHKLAEVGVTVDFVQDNLSHSRAGVLRGLHYQLGAGQAKLIKLVTGRVLDVAVDVRRGSPTFGAWEAVELDAQAHRMVYIPAGFAHGFFTLEEADVLYKCSDRYQPELERGIAWDDPTLAINWPSASPQLSERDTRLPGLDQVSAADLPHYEGTPEDS